MFRFKKGPWLPICLALVLALAAGCATNQAARTSAKAESGKAADWQFHTIVDAAFVQQYAKVPQPKGVMIVDARPYKPKYIKGHIPTAVSIPFSKFDKLKDKLPKDKNDLLIFYCGGPT